MAGSAGRKDFRCSSPKQHNAKTMDETNKHDPDAGFEPAFAAPPNACDTHFHVFGAAERYSYGTDIRYKPPYEPLEAYLKVVRRLGFVRYVFVQPSAYGFDNSCMLDSMCELDPAVRRGIIDPDEGRTTDKELSNLNAVGVRTVKPEALPSSRRDQQGATTLYKSKTAKTYTGFALGLFKTQSLPQPL